MSYKLIGSIDPKTDLINPKSHISKISKCKKVITYSFVLLNLRVGSQSHKRGCLCFAKAKERRSLWIRSLHVVVSVSSVGG